MIGRQAPVRHGPIGIGRKGIPLTPKVSEPKTPAPGYRTVAPRLPSDQPKKFVFGSKDARPKYRDENKDKPILEPGHRMRVIDNANDPAKKQFLKRKQEIEKQEMEMLEKKKEIDEAKEPKGSMKRQERRRRSRRIKIKKRIRGTHSGQRLVQPKAMLKKRWRKESTTRQKN